MVFDLDLFPDMLPEPAGVNARAGAKFQPKAKPRIGKETIITVPSGLPSVTKEESITPVSSLSDSSQSVPPIVTPIITPCNTALTNPLYKLPEPQESVNGIEDLYPGLPLSDGDKSSAPVEVSPQHVMTREDMDSTVRSYRLQSPRRSSCWFCQIRRDCRYFF